MINRPLKGKSIWTYKNLILTGQQLEYTYNILAPHIEGVKKVNNVGV